MVKEASPEIRTQSFLAQEARKGLGRAGTLFASGSAGLGEGARGKVIAARWRSR